MSYLELRDTRAAPKSRSLTLRWGLLAIVPVGELLALSLHFDTARLSAGDSPWTRLAGETPALLRIALALVAALVLILAPRVETIGREARCCASDHPWPRWLLLHLLAFGAFYQANAMLFSRVEAGVQVPGGLIGGWAGLGVGALGLWLMVMAPAGFWSRLAVREWRAWVAAALVGAAVWLGGRLAQEFWKPLAAGTFWLSHGLLSLIYPNVVHDAERRVLGTPSFLVDIAPSCSGYEGIGLVTVFLGVYLWLFRAELRFPQAFLLFPIGALAIWLVNAIRIALLIAVGTSLSPELALGGFHSQAGWIAFIAIALALMLVARRLRLFAKGAGCRAAGEKNDAAAPLLVPLLVLMGATVLTSALQGEGFDRLYPLRVMAAALALWHFRRVYLAWDWTLSWQGLVVGVAVFVLWIALEPPANAAGPVLETAWATLPAGERALWLGSRIVGSTMIVPWVEELAFRGYLLRRLAGQDLKEPASPRFTWSAFVLTSLAFGLLHTRWLAGTLAGMAYALAFYRRGKLGDAVAAHMISNGLIALAVLAADRWSLWT